MQRVLIIEDDPHVRALFAEVLGDEGYDVEVAADGEEGLDAYSRNPPDIVISDIFMPEKTGIEVAVDVWRRHPDAKIIFVSGVLKGQVNAGYLREQLGAVRVLEKPVSPDALVNAVQQALAEKPPLPPQ